MPRVYIPKKRRVPVVGLKDPQRVPAPQYDVMRAPAYVPSKTLPVRPGSLDFKALRSMCFVQLEGAGHG